MRITATDGVNSKLYSDRELAALQKLPRQIINPKASSRFQTLQGALACLMEDFNLVGLEAQDDDQLRMFR